MVRILTGLAIWIGFAVAAIGSGIMSFIDVPSVMIVLGGSFALLLINFSFVEMKTIIIQTLTLSSMDPDDRHKAILFWQAATRAYLCTGTIGTLIGLVLMLQQLDDPSAIGPAMAVALLTIMYALVLTGATSLPGEFIIRQMETSEDENR